MYFPKAGALRPPAPPCTFFSVSASVFHRAGGRLLPFSRRSSHPPRPAVRACTTSSSSVAVHLTLRYSSINSLTFVEIFLDQQSGGSVSWQVGIQCGGDRRHYCPRRLRSVFPVNWTPFSPQTGFQVWRRSHISNPFHLCPVLRRRVPPSRYDLHVRLRAGVHAGAHRCHRVPLSVGV